ncbi:MAG: TM2 domain-containing protein [Pseudomonadales bacterium]|nr:TM2 domain-containing protein [Pseudomonadales bacterium]
MDVRESSHSLLVGYLLWILGFLGAHRFYYGRQLTGTLYFFTFGLFGIGWLIDFFLIPGMDAEADFRYESGSKNYDLAWVLLTFFGLFGLHRFYMEKWFTGLLYLFTGGLLGVGYIYDYWTLNEQLDYLHRVENLYE